jgi:hypothetical protein
VAKIQTGEFQMQVLGITVEKYMLVISSCGAFQSSSKLDILLMACTNVTLAAVLAAW